MKLLTYEDFQIGRRFDLGPRKVSEDEIIAFAKKFDPQPFHLDPQSAHAQSVGGLIASGWHTCSIFMRMMCDGYILSTASQGSAGLDEVRWVKPVRPGDTLTGTAEVVGRRISSKRPGIGFVQFDYVMRNQNDEMVMLISGNGMVSVGMP